MHNPSKELQRTATKDLLYDYKELPLGNRAFALRMLYLQQKKQKEKEEQMQLRQNEFWGKLKKRPATK